MLWSVVASAIEGKRFESESLVVGILSGPSAFVGSGVVLGGGGDWSVE